MIRPPNEGIEVWLCVEPVDFRKQITGLAALVQDTLAMDPFSTQLFVFANRRRTQCRILYWERCGFVLWQISLPALRGASAHRCDARAGAAQEPRQPRAARPRGHREVRRCAATVSPAPATEAPRGRPLAHHAGDVDGARRRTRGPSRQPATRGVARTPLPADGRNHRAGAQRTRQGRAIEVPTLGADERRPPASGPRGQAPNRPSSCSTTTPPAPATSPNACLQGSPARCTPTATAAMDRWYASRGWCTWRAGPMPGAGSPTPSKASA